MQERVLSSSFAPDASACADAACAERDRPCVNRRPLRRQRRRGVGLLELVVVFPTLMFVMLGVVEFGQYFYIRSCFEAAARDACRAAILETAASTDPATKAAATLAQANITFNSSWMTIVDYTNSSSTVTDVTTVPFGHTLIVTIQAQYSSIPNVYRPLSAMTGIGVGSSRMCTGQCQMIRE